MADQLGVGQLGQRLAQIRKRQGMSQAELAELCGVDPVTVSRWETGTRVPDLHAVIRLTQALGVGLDVIVGPIYRPQLDTDDPAEVELVHIWRRLAAADQQLVVGVMRRLLVG